MRYKQLDYKKRCQILGLWRAGYTQIQIAKEVGTNQSTISRELNRNITFIRAKLGCWQYKPDYAHGYAKERHKNKKKKIKLTHEVTKFICDKIQQKWSPEQISGYAKKHNLFFLCKEWIYQFILRDKEKGGKLYLNLRHQNKKYRKRYGSPKRTGPIKNRRFINERPAVVDEKSRVGDWEIDTIIGKQQKQAVISIVERFSKKTILKKVSKKTAISVATATIEGLKLYTNSILSITSDNGSEFAYHEMISQELNTDFYFAHPYSSWQRGLNENTNGLVRQYLKKGSSFSEIENADLEIIMNDLNNRPRKRLGFATPNEIFNFP
ncbi:MAG: IS30 family transposase [Pseudomonadota bacterium]